MKILYISKYATFPPYSGSRQYYLSQEFISLGHEVVLLCSNSNHLATHIPKGFTFYKVFTINGLRVLCFNVLKYSISGSLLRVLSWLQFDFYVLLHLLISRKYERVIVSSLSLTTIFPVVILKAFFNYKIVFEVRDIWPLSPKILKGEFGLLEAFFFRMLELLEIIGYNRSDYIVGTMPNLLQHVLEVCPKAGKKVHWVPQGFVSNSLDNLMSSGDSNFSFDTNKIVFGYFGTLNLNNPISDVLECLSKFNNDVVVIVVGEGEQKEYLLKRFALTNIIFLQRMDKSKLFKLFENVDICFDALDNRISKFGTSRYKTIEYLLLSKPVLHYTSVKGDFIGSKNLGWVVEFGDINALHSLLVNVLAYSKEELSLIGVKNSNYVLRNHNFEVLAKSYPLK